MFRRMRHATPLSRLALGVLLLALLAYLAGPANLAETLSRASWRWIAVVFVLLATGVLMGAVNIWILLRCVTDVPFAAFLRIYIASWAAGLVLPSQLGDATQVLFLQRRGIPVRIGGAAYALDKTISMGWLLLIGTCGTFVYLPVSYAERMTGMAIAALAAAAVAMILFLRMPNRSNSLFGRVQHHGHLFVEQLAVFRRHRAAVVANISATVLKWGLTAVCHAAAFRAFGVPVSLSVTAFIPIMANLVGYIPISAAGLGTTELTAVALYSLVGIDQPTVLSVWLVIRGLQFLGAAVLLPALSRFGRQTDAGQPPSAGPPTGGRAALRYDQQESNRMTTTSSKAGSKILLGCVACLISLTLVELGLQVVYYVRSTRTFRRGALASKASADAYRSPEDYYGKWDLFPVMQYNSFLGYIPKANHSGNGYATNNVHCRYREPIDAEKDPAEFRIFVTGGSAAWGSGVRQEQLYSEAIERQLAERYPNLRVRVIPAAAGGHTSTNERIWIENFISDLAPDYVIMLSGWNDTYRAYHGVDPLADNDFMSFAKVLSNRVERVMLPDELHPQLLPPNFADYWFKLHYLIDKSAYRAAHRSDQLAADVRAQSVDRERVIESLLRNVQIAADVARRRNFHLVFALQPSLYSTDKKLSAFEQGLLDGYRTRFVGFPDYNRHIYERYRELLSEDAPANGYEFVDSDAAIDGETKSVFADHVHLGDRGHELLAAWLLDVLEQRLHTRLAAMNDKAGQIKRR